MQNLLLNLSGSYVPKNLQDKKNILSLLDKINSFNETPTFFYFHMMSVHQISVTDKKYKRFDTGNINLGSSKYDSESLTNDYKNRMIQLDDYVRKLYNILKRKGRKEEQEEDEENEEEAVADAGADKSAGAKSKEVKK